jgi:peptidoglycan/xylan/chitin deacetylase (PgdA/CDA1 family)
MGKGKKRLNPSGFIILIIMIVTIGYFMMNKDAKIERYMVDLTNYNLNQIKEFVNINNLDLEIKYEHNDTIEKDKVISQNIMENTLLQDNDKLIVYISLGPIPVDLYKEKKVNELGVIPVMMYHGIHYLKNSDTPYTGGNVDRDGYNRTSEAFIDDLEFYYQNGYRMIRLKDYIDGNIDVPLGMSPIILTFDDGLENNIKVLDKKDNGELIIDPNSAIGILESFKKKYPDYQVTATFFLNKGLFNQPEYNEDIIKWLVDNGYDIGNHTANHYNLANLSSNNVKKEVATIYQLLDTIIPDKYLKIIALPHGTPYNRNHQNFPVILSGTYDGYDYTTECTLRVGWEPELSPYDINFNKTFIKRVRAWDNNGTEFDIESTFKRLESNRYISSGNKDIIVIPKSKSNRLNNNLNDKRVVTYE